MVGVDKKKLGKEKEEKGKKKKKKKEKKMYINARVPAPFSVVSCL